MTYTRAQIEVMRARLQEYVDIGWNGGTARLTGDGNECSLCVGFGRHFDHRSWWCCEPCPLGDEDNRPGCGIACGRRNRIRNQSKGFRSAARAHARWLVRRYNAADEGGTWEIV